MKNALSKINPLKSFLGLFLVATVVLWFKTYITQSTQFNLEVEGTVQQFLLAINPIASILVVLSLSFLFKGKRKYTALIILYTIMSILLYANAVYYRFFSDFITLPTFFQTQNFGDLGGSVVSLLNVTDLFYFVDVFILIYLRASKKVVKTPKRVGWLPSIAVLAVAGFILVTNYNMAEDDRPDLLTRGFDRTYIVKYLGIYNFIVYDAVETIEAQSERALADSSDITEVQNYIDSKKIPANVEYFGKAQGKNVVYIHLESMQQFLMNYQLNGQEVTPFLNSLIQDENTIYFDNVFHQTAQGKTADAEFMLENSLFGLPQGSAYITKGQNTFQAAPGILKDYGYTSAVFHGNNGTFWNRNVIYKAFGYDEFFDGNYYDTSNEQDLAEYGLLDKPFFEQSEQYIETLPEPFYTKYITVANHFPYKMDQSLVSIEKATTGDASVDNYFQTARYADEAIAEFFNYLKESGLYDRTIFVLYGDHYGISDNHNEAMAQILGKEEITPVDSMNLQRIPFMIHMPGLEGGVNHTFGGQVDILPTVLNLLGVNTDEYIQMGTDLLAEDREQVVAFRNGDYASPSIYSIGGKYYDPQTGSIIEDETTLAQADEYQNEVTDLLKYSDKVVNGDLLRFYTPSNFTKINPADYNYNLNAKKVVKDELE